ncbi:hypothetical protein D3C87_1171580 [compost metagenome]
MKKQILFAVVAMIPVLSFAKVADFNALITDNMKAQTELHTTVTGNMAETRKAVADANIKERIVIVENSGTSYNSPTKKDMLAFKKEKTFYRASDMDSLDRVATEIRDQD